jgi:hypothetical protein
MVMDYGVLLPRLLPNRFQKTQKNLKVAGFLAEIEALTTHKEFYYT